MLYLRSFYWIKLPFYVVCYTYLYPFSCSLFYTEDRCSHREIRTFNDMIDDVIMWSVTHDLVSDSAWLSHDLVSDCLVVTWPCEWLLGCHMTLWVTLLGCHMTLWVTLLGCHMTLWVTLLGCHIAQSYLLEGACWRRKNRPATRLFQVQRIFNYFLLSQHTQWKWLINLSYTLIFDV